MEHANTPSNRVYDELYDAEDLSTSIVTLLHGRQKRLDKIKLLRRKLERHETAAKLAPADKARKALVRDCKRAVRRVERPEEALRWALDVDKTASHADAKGRRHRRVEYWRTRLKISNIDVGRQYSSSSDKPVRCATSRNPKALSLQGMPRELRRLLCHRHYMDVDMQNSFPSLACALATRCGIQLPALAAYADAGPKAREDILKEIMSLHGLFDRDDAKKLPISLLHGGDYRSWLFNVDPPKKEARHKLMEGFANEMKQLIKAVLAYDGPIERAIASERANFISGLTGSKPRSAVAWKEGDVPEVDRTMFSYVMQTYENWMLTIVIDVFETAGWVIGSLQFDGLYVQADATLDLECTMRAAEAAVTDRMREGGFTVALTHKPLFGAPIKMILDDWNTAHMDA